MFQPKRTKYRKMQKGRNKGVKINSVINFGSFAIKAISSGCITSRQIEATRRVISRSIKRQGQIWICIFPDRPFTKKPLEVRMGKGKGNVEYWGCYIQPGKILYEIGGVDECLARCAFRSASSKLPVKVIFVKKGYSNEITYNI